MRGAQLNKADEKTHEAETQTVAALAAKDYWSQQAKQAKAHADELRRKLGETQAAVAAEATTAEAAASSTIGELRKRLAAVKEKLGEAEKRVAAGAGARARAEEEGAKAQDLREALEESVAERAKVWYKWWFCPSVLSCLAVRSLRSCGACVCTLEPWVHGRVGGGACMHA